MSSFSDHSRPIHLASFFDISTPLPPPRWCKLCTGTWHINDRLFWCHWGEWFDIHCYISYSSVSVYLIIGICHLLPNPLPMYSLIGWHNLWTAPQFKLPKSRTFVLSNPGPPTFLDVFFKVLIEALDQKTLDHSLRSLLQIYKDGIRNKPYIER